jgi:hypothetical protein
MAKNTLHKEVLKSASTYSTFSKPAYNTLSENTKQSESAVINSSLSGTTTLTVTALPLNVVKGTAVSTVAAAGLYTVTGLLNGDIASNVLTGNISYSTNYTATTVEGTTGLTINPSGLSSTNYTISYVSAAINVSNSTLIATALDKAVLVQWKTNTNALGYIVEYKPSTSLNWIAAINSNSPMNGHSITGLINGLNYDIRVTTKLANNTYTYAIVSALPSSASDMTIFYNQILSTGQSLSIGVGATPNLTITQPYLNKGLNSNQTALIPLVEPAFSSTQGAETMSSALANSLTYYSGLGSNYKSIVSICGVGGTKYIGLKKGTQSYTNGLGQISNALNYSINSNTPFKVNAITTIHGESDNSDGTSTEDYASYLVEWQRDFNTDIKSITGQTNDIPLFTDQLRMRSTVFGGGSTGSNVSIGQWIAARDNLNKIILVTPKYIFDYVDPVHLSNYSTRRLGEYYGKVMKKVLVDKETWLPLSPKKLTIYNNVIIAEFNVPVEPLAIDNTAVSAKTNLGFEYFDNSNSASINAVSILNSHTIKITLSTTPTGNNKRLRYGAPSGNIRDSDTTPALYNDANVPVKMGNLLRNWLITFDDPLITQTNHDPYIVATGATPNYIINGLPQGPETVLTNSTGNVTYIYSGIGSTTYTPTSIKPTNLGTYQVVASVEANGIYNTASSSPLLFAITKPNITITALNQSKLYGEMQSINGVLGSTYSVTGLKNGDSVGSITLNYSGLLTGNLSTASVGTYDISASGLTLTSGSLNDYTISYIPGILTVNASTLTVTVLPQIKEYGETLSRTGILGNTFSILGLINKDTVSGISLDFSGTPAGNLSTAPLGTYSISGRGLTLSSGSLTNYRITYVQGSLTVTASTLTVTALPQSKAFRNILSGTGILDNTYSVLGLKNGDTVSEVFLAYSGTPAGNLSTASVGKYSITPSGLTLSSGNINNYIINYVQGTLNIEGPQLTVTALPQTKEIGDEVSTIGVSNTTFKVIGLMDGDIASGVTLAYSGSPTGNLATASEGKYSITPSGLTLSSGNINNYMILYVPGVLSVVNQVENSSPTKGILLPRMTTSQRDTIATPANSLLIFNTTNDRFEVYKNTCTCWVPVFDGGNTAAPK